MSDEMTKIKQLLGDLEEEPLLTLVKQRLDAGDEPLALVEACRDGMQIVGERFASKEYFVNDLVISAEIFNGVMDILGPQLAASGDSGPKTRVVVGTAQGDIHDIGKNIVVAMLRCNGFEVYDVGVDVPPQVFVDKVKETGATIVGISGLLTLAFSGMEATIKGLNDAGLRDKVKVLVGGGPVTDAVCEQVGADALGRDAMEAVTLVRSFAGVKVS